MPAAGAESADPDLLAALKAWRLEQARQQRLPPYVVFHDRTLVAIAERRPRGLDELAGLTGIGNAKLASYGEAVLEVGKAEKVRIYAAAGPMIMPILTYSEGYQDNAIGNDYYYRNNENAFSYGLYGRTGVEIRVNEYGMLGIGLRGTWVETDLGNVNDFTGLGAFVTYTAGL